MKKKILAAAIAGCLATPAAYAAIDDAGMKYTSASEGFYGSLRFALRSSEDNDASVSHESSRFGVQGDVDVGHGNAAFYRGEWRVRYDRSNDEPFATRLAYIGMKGAFGSVRFGQIWSAEYDHVFSLADVTNNVTGLISPTFRIKNALRYDSPDIKGFNFSLQAQANDGEGRTTGANPASGPLTDADIVLLDATTGTDGLDPADVNAYLQATAPQQEAFRAAHGLEDITNELGAATGVRVAANAGVTDPDDGNEFDRYVVAGSYGIRGLNLAATYVSEQKADSSSNTDSTTWGLGGTYGQDNWKVGYVYRDTSDLSGISGNDLQAHSFSGQVSFDKVTLRAVLETNELDQAGGGSADSDVFTLEAQYSFSSLARAYVNYQNRDTEGGGYDAYNGAIVNTASGSDLDIFYVAYRVDF